MEPLIDPKVMVFLSFIPVTDDELQAFNFRALFFFFFIAGKLDSVHRSGVCVHPLLLKLGHLDL